MSFGKFRCIGPALHLKNRYGLGYRLNVLTSKPEAFISYVKEQFPEMTLNHRTEGNLTFQCDLDKLSLLADFTEVLDSKISELAIEDWGIQHTSLEDVFLKVTAESDFGFKETDKKEKKSHQKTKDSKMKNDDDLHVSNKRSKSEESSKSEDSSKSNGQDMSEKKKSLSSVSDSEE